jgi:pimeloyl-ACP methyl ester carboxylesterase
MAIFVLVHGGWTGAHGFRTVRRLLQGHGHEVFTPCLTGVGERVHLASPQVGLTTHVQDVVNCLEFEDLRDVVLLGFSYGGVVVTGVIEHAAQRVRELVYLDAFVPADGQSVSSLVGEDRSPVMHIGDDWLVPPPARHFDDAAEGAWQNARRVAHPWRCFTEPVRLSTPLEDQAFGLTYIKAIGDPPDSPGGRAFYAAADHAKSSPRWHYREIDTTHMVASNRPDQLVSILLELRHHRTT